MCGICGYTDKFNIFSQKHIYEMNKIINHRGPDEEGYYFHENIALGHKRLNIIDLSGGKQPMTNDDKTLVIVFNGEIYNFKSIKNELLSKNYKFYTDSDTEVLLKSYEEWGNECLKKLNGMFAFAILNLKNREIFLARDRFGQKPLFYYHNNSTFIFSSELTSILKYPTIRKNVNTSALQQYLFYEYVPAPLSMIEGVNKLSAGHSLVFSKDRIKITQYWDLRFNSSLIENTNSEFYDDNFIENNVIELLKESIKLRLVSDVPLGIFLSGGIDSSSLIALLSEITDTTKIKTFSIGFDEKSYDERNYANIVSDRYKTIHYEDVLSPDVMFNIIPDIIFKLDEPLADNSIIPTYLLSKFTRNYVTVALGGDGGDELFAGYDPFLAHWLIRNFRLPEFSVKILLQILHTFFQPSNQNMSLEFRMKRTLSGLNFSPHLRNEIWMSAFSYEMQQNLFNKTNKINSNIKVKYKDNTSMLVPANKKIIYNPVVELNYKNKSLIQKIIYLYSKLYLQNDILAKVDKASMMNSLEVRAPFLDVNFAEYINSLHDKYKIRYGIRKYILKKIMKKKLPVEIIKRQKKGFGVPVNKWLKTDLKDLLVSTLNKNDIKSENIFNYNYIEKLISDHLNNHRNNSKELWSLLIFQLWKNKLNKI